MKIILLQIGKTNIKYISDGVSDYSARIMKYAGFEIVTIADLKNAGNLHVDELKIREGKALMKLLHNEDYVIVLDEKGKEFNTPEFSAKLEKIFQESRKRIIFIIGGAWGISRELAARADLLLSMSKLTFSHQMVRLLFTEQLYRALTIIKGDPYHHD